MKRTRIPKSALISIENGATPQYDDDGKIVEDIATCETCGNSWNDALITGTTPAPSGRCPYEYFHKAALLLFVLALSLRAMADELPAAPEASTVTVSTVAPIKTHVFHRSDLAQMGALAAANALDFVSTEHGLAQPKIWVGSRWYGWQEKQLPSALVANKAGFAGYLAVKTVGQGFAQYELDKHHHRKLAALVADVEIGATFGTDANNLRTAGNYAPAGKAAAPVFRHK